MYTTINYVSFQKPKDGSDYKQTQVQKQHDHVNRHRKIFGKAQHSFMIKAQKKKLGLEGTYLTTKGICDQGEAKILPLKSVMRQDAHSILFSIALVISQGDPWKSLYNLILKSP